jgi:hypothetical protein
MRKVFLRMRFLSVVHRGRLLGQLKKRRLLRLLKLKPAVVKPKELVRTTKACPRLSIFL